ncbi:MAG: DNA helicase RecQ [Candidatus Omnitrophica bacterium]|nr:DNA helicase RecQ [Candidatus Omnitrophota bacterium]
MKDTIYRLLDQYWGYESFLPLQENTIFSILKGQDSLTVLSTGGGKSLCFQLPALLEKGLAVVISPLISLMKDQVDGLNDMGIPAAYLNSSLSVVNQRAVIEAINSGSIRLLYLSPERLQNEATLDLLKKVGVDFFVIDEAHCISHWGHDFRAEYRTLGIIKGIFTSASVHAFTATATKEVQIDILKQLGLDSPVIHTGQVDRINLTYRVMQRQQIVKQITEVLDKHQDEPGVIYCLRRKDVDNLSKTLEKLGYDNVPYHAGMPDKQRQANQEKFVSESVNIIVATVAFGMGIDRSNIRFVIHEGMPKSIEHYQQQTGRAGRDGLPAFCYMFYSGSDYQLWSFFAKKSSENKTVMHKLGLMYDFCAQPQCRHKVLVNYFDQQYSKDGCNACDYCLNELEMVEAPLLVGQNIVACVDSLTQQGYGFGAVYIAEVLKGKLTDKIIKMHHHELPRFGIMAEESSSFIRYMIEQLIGQGFLQREGEFSILVMTAKGEQLLDGELAPVLAKPLVEQKKKQVEQQSVAIRQQEWQGVDEGLFQKLRQIRAEIARKKGVPAYIVFGDKTLKDMAARKPSNIDDFADIYGVGDRKLKIYAKAFIDVINSNEGVQEKALEDVF